MSSETLKTILEHWLPDEEKFEGEFGTLELPFDVEGFCSVMDARIAELENQRNDTKNHNSK